MAKVAFILASDFEDSEFRVPYDRLTEAGHQVVVAGPSAGQELTGKKGNETVTPDTAISDLDPEDFDALVIPGGYSPDKLRLEESAVRFTRAMFNTGRTVAAVCHAGSLLVDADVIEGLTVTSWPSIRRDLENAGATWVDQEVVEEANLITSRNPDDLPAFSDAILARLEEKVSA